MTDKDIAKIEQPTFDAVVNSLISIGIRKSDAEGYASDVVQMCWDLSFHDECTFEEAVKKIRGVINTGDFDANPKPSN